MASRRTSAPVRRAEFDELRRVVRSSMQELQSTVDRCSRDLDLQFSRIAQIQAQLDEIGGAWSKIKPRSRRR